MPVVKFPLAGDPKAGVTNVGLVANTNAPEPVSSLTAAAKLAEVGVARNVATLAPRPVTLPIAGVIVVFVTLVICPWAFTANTGVAVAEP